MLVDAERLTPGHRLDADVVVIGAGAAGIPLSVELIKAGRRVLLVESGGLRQTGSTRALSRGEVLDPRHGSLERYRVRGLGGTTSVWGGRCAPLDPIDFERRDHIGESGWPLGYQELATFYRLAHSYLGLGPFRYDAAALETPHTPGFESPSFHSDTLWRYSHPVHLGRRWRRFLRESREATVLLNATCVRLHMSEDGERVEACELRGLSGEAWTATGGQIVVAGGGLETTRLLLASKSSSHPTGIGNHSGHLGRYYTSHISGHLGPFRWIGDRRLPGLRYERDPSGVYVRRTLSLRPERQRELGLPNLRLSVSVPPMHDPSHGSGVLSAAFLVKRFLLNRIPPEFDAAFGRSHHTSIYRSHLINLLRNLPELAAFAPWWLARRIVPSRKIPSMEPKPGATFYLHFDCEQRPLRESQVVLGEHLDVLGVPQLRVDWRVADEDFMSLAKAYRLLTTELEEAGIAHAEEGAEAMAGRVRDQVGIGSHHIGTTRMSATPEKGVVDRDCRVFGVRNLSIASSSVFPTPGVANPTLTITAIALRIADRLGRE